MRDQGNSTRHKSTLRLRGASNLAPGLLRERAPYMADIHANLFENLSAHQARLTAALQAVSRRLAPRTRLKAARRFKGFKRCTKPRLQITEESRRRIGKVVVRAQGRLRHFLVLSCT